MNTNRVKTAVAKSLYPFILTSSKRVMTVNYFNLMVILPSEESALLNFLIKESTQYNTFKYSTKLLEKYKMYIRAVKRNFSADVKFKTDPKYTREIFISLIEKGLLFRVGSEYVINFAISYCPQYHIAVRGWMVNYSSDKVLYSEDVLRLNKEMLKTIRR